MEETCCWKCRDCGSYQIRVDESNCEDCKLGTLPDEANRSKCVAIRETYIDYTNPLGMGAMGVATFGTYSNNANQREKQVLHLQS